MIEIKVVSSLGLLWNILVYTFGGTYTLIFLVNMTRSGITSADIAKVFFKVLVNTYTPNNDCWELQLLHIVPDSIVTLWNLSLQGKHVVVPHCGFNLHLLCRQKCRAHFPSPADHLIPSYWSPCSRLALFHWVFFFKNYLQERCIYSSHIFCWICELQYLLPVCELSFHLVNGVFWLINIFNFHKIKGLFIFVLISGFGYCLRNLLPTPKMWKYCPIAF